MRRILFWSGCLFFVLSFAGMVLGSVILEAGNLERDRSEGVHETPTPISFEELASDAPLDNRHIVIYDLAVCSKEHSKKKLNAVISHAPAYSALAKSEPAANEIRVIVMTWSNAGESGPFTSIKSGRVEGVVEDVLFDLEPDVRRVIEEYYPGIDVDNCRILVVGSSSPTLERAKIITWGGRGIFTASFVASCCSVWVIRKVKHTPAKQDTESTALRPAIDQSF